MQAGPIGRVPHGKMSDYLINLLDWLEANAASRKIERWLLDTSWKENVNVVGAMGVISVTALARAFLSTAWARPIVRGP